MTHLLLTFSFQKQLIIIVKRKERKKEQISKHEFPKLALVNSHVDTPLCFCHSTAREFVLLQQLYNYTSNSTYGNNLNTLLSSLSSNLNDTGFYTSSAGQTPNIAYATAVCRTDIQLDSCRTCVQNATVDLVNVCPYQKQAIIWRELCTLRYSDEPLFGIRADSPYVQLRNTMNASSAAQFKEDLRTLIDDLRDQAAGGGASVLKVAAGNILGPDFQTIFGILQCSPDLSSDDCTGCLINAAGIIPGCCDSARGARILTPSCNLHYETYSLYNITRILEVQQIATPAVTIPAPKLVT